jgi:rhamnulokinase
MGLWLVQRCRLSFQQRGGVADYPELVRAAEAATAFQTIINPDDPSFLNPPDMPAAIAQYCASRGIAVPRTEGEFVRCSLESLALKYAAVLRQIVEITGREMSIIHVVGGGARNRLLNQFTANACNLPVAAGPVEATVLGNLLVQARADDQIASLSEMRAAARASSEIEEFIPEPDSRWREMHSPADV